MNSESIGRYQIVKVLGHGGMGTVYEATDPSLGRRVAVKTIRADLAEDRESLVNRFFVEARSLGRLHHPNIVVVHDFEERDGLLYLVMEYLEGRSLAALLTAGLRPKPALFARMILETASALDYAHNQGVLHRDIKPANIMVADNGVVKLVDFGIARLADSTTLTQTGLIPGTVRYMAPESIAHPDRYKSDPRLDQYSLGAVAFEVLAGRAPFDAPSLPALIHRLVNEPAPPIWQATPQWAYPVNQVLGRVLSKQPEQRYASCTEFARALQQALGPCIQEGRFPALEPPTVNPVRPPTDSGSTHAEDAAWRAIAASGDPSLIRRFLNTNPSPALRERALAELARLEQQARPAAAPPPPPPPPPPPTPPVVVARKPGARPLTSALAGLAGFVVVGGLWVGYRTYSSQPPAQEPAATHEMIVQTPAPQTQPPTKAALPEEGLRVVEQATIIEPHKPAAEPSDDEKARKLLGEMAMRMGLSELKTETKDGQRVVITTQTTGDRPPLAQLIGEAQRASQPELAFVLLAEAIRFYPDSPDPYFQRGLLSLRQRNFAAAIRDFTHVVRIAPDFADAYRHRGNARIQLGQTADGEKDLAMATSLDGRR